MAKHLESAFTSARAAGVPAFVAYVTAGFPTPAHTVDALLAMQEQGVSVIEVGVPFSDPLADGGTIQRANQVALQHGVHLRDVLAFVREGRSRGLTVPVVLMGYYNPFLRYGEEKLVDDCADAGVNGFIVVDLPGEDATSFLAACDRRGLAFIPLVAPTTLTDRLDMIAKVARGFVYCVSVTGVTGARTEVPADLADLVARVKSKVSVPVAVGFGIADRSQVDTIGKMADGVVMGSAIINKLADGGVDGLRKFLADVVPRPAAAAAAV